jgi:4-hydroxy-2-oxoheptanedioate aldolase
MTVNRALAKMRRGEPAFGYALELGSPVAAEVLAESGVDFLMVDTQHGSYNNPESTAFSFMAISTGPATPMARVATNNYTQIGRLLDEGALGIIVPMVDTPEQARAAADACRYPPAGARSWGWGRAVRHNPDYTTTVNDEMFVAVQIESAQAVENAEAIMATPGVDGCWIGPGDLALSLGIHPSVSYGDERHEAAIARVLEACRNTGKIPGFAAFTPQEAKKRAEQGFLFLTAGTDLLFMQEGVRNGVAYLYGDRGAQGDTYGN